MTRRRLFIGFGLMLLMLAGGGYVFRAALTAQYQLYRFRHAADPSWEEQVPLLASHGARFRPRLVAWLDDADESVRIRATVVLAAWAEECGTACELMRELNQGFSHRNEHGRAAVLALATRLSAHVSDDERTVGRALAAQGCDDAAAPVRERAACLAMKCQPALVPSLVKLLSAAEPEVRRAALLAIGGCRELVGDEELLRWLHDPDAEVRQLCATTLGSRGLREQDIRMGRLLTAPKPADRLRLVELLGGDIDVDRAAWLGRLANDPAPAVRAAVARIAVERGIPGLSEQLARLARTDPDATVRGNAQHYWSKSGGVRTAAAP